MIKYIIYINYIFISISFFGQSIQNVDFEVRGKTIITRYELIGREKSMYDVRLNLIDTRNQVFIKPTSITGDINNVRPGRNKSISWNVPDDVEELQGRFRMQVEIINFRSFKISGGGRNALLSLFVPTLGSWYVASKGGFSQYYPTISTTGFLLSLYFSGDAISQAYKSYNLYLNSSNQSDLDFYYNQYTRNTNKAANYLMTAGSIYAFDVFYTFIKGNLNASKQRRGVSWNNIKASWL